MRICVIGAGAAGLAVARLASAIPAVTKLVVVEQNTEVGGTWIYTEETGADSKHGRPIHSSMYRRMRTNIPKEAMGFPDFPFPHDPPESFVHHSEVLKYLKNYASHFDIHKYIQFETVIDHLEKVDGLWRATIRDLNSGTVKVEDFDSTFMCNGHYAEPHSPNIPGLSDFKGQIMHSHNYRDPEPFRNQRVICLGAGPSGIDISVEIAQQADKVYLSHNRKPFRSPMPGNLEQVVGIQSVGSGSVTLRNGEELKDMDAIILCTGYHYRYPMLDPKSVPELSVDSLTRVSPLFQHLVYIPDPTLFFIGLCVRVCPFPFFHAQAEYALALVTGICSPPSEAFMRRFEEADVELRRRKYPDQKIAHFMGPLQWDYVDDLYRLIQGKPIRVPAASFSEEGIVVDDDHDDEPVQTPISPAVRGLFDELREIRGKDLTKYKDDRWRIDGPDTFFKVLNDNDDDAKAA